MIHRPLQRCGACPHIRDAHRKEGFFNQVTEPKHQPSAPQCEDCYIERPNKEDTRFLHAFKEQS